MTARHLDVITLPIGSVAAEAHSQQKLTLPDLHYIMLSCWPASQVTQCVRRQFCILSTWYVDDKQFRMDTHTASTASEACIAEILAYGGGNLEHNS